jgi:hypothetical protein
VDVYEHRIVNGLLKEGVDDPEQARALLRRDVEVYVEPGREHELAPATWALIAALRRQFTGSVRLLNAAAGADPRFPVRLEPWLSESSQWSSPLRVALGSCGQAASVWGDVRGSAIAFRSTVDRAHGPAHAVAGFALAGYLAFALLAEAVGIPPLRARHAGAMLHLPVPTRVALPDAIAVLGLGQIGQALLALLHFVEPDARQRPKLTIVDCDRFGPENFATQVLLADEHAGIGSEKTEYLSQLLSRNGWRVEPLRLRLEWDTAKPRCPPPVALVAFDNFDARRIAVSWGYDWLAEAGVGTSLFEPRVTWSSLPPDSRLATDLFRNVQHQTRALRVAETPFGDSLRATPGQCGWLIFRDIAASAPCLGLVAAAFSLAELLLATSGVREPVRGVAHLWSPLLPYLREPLTL